MFRYLYTADPAAHVFSDGRLWLYADRDPARPNKTWMSMCSYHAFSTADLLNWIDHGTVLTCDEIAWCGGAAWDGDCVERHGKYWYFFPMIDQIGVAVADKPEGPFRDALGHPLITRQTRGVLPRSPQGGLLVSPVVVNSPDGLFLYFGQNEALYIVELKDSMVELAGPVRRVAAPEVYHEGPWVFFRSGHYHIIYGRGAVTDDLEDQCDNLAYASAKQPDGPFTFHNIVQKDLGRTVQACLVEWDGKDILFYHEDGPDNYHRHIRAEMVDRPGDGGVELIPRGSAPLIPESVRLDARGRHSGEDYHEAGGQVERLKLEEGRCGFVRLRGQDAVIKFSHWTADNPVYSFIAVIRNNPSGKASFQVHLAGEPITTLELPVNPEAPADWQEVIVPLQFPLAGDFGSLRIRGTGDLKHFSFV